MHQKCKTLFVVADEQNKECFGKSERKIVSTLMCPLNSKLQPAVGRLV